MVFFAEAYYAGLVREMVFDAAGSALGRIGDLYVRPNPGSLYPVLSLVEVRLRHEPRVAYIPWPQVRSASYEGFRLSCALDDAQVEGPAEEDV